MKSLPEQSQEPVGLLYEIPADVNRMLNIYKAELGLKSKPEALNHLIRKVLGKRKK